MGGRLTCYSCAPLFDSGTATLWVVTSLLTVEKRKEKRRDASRKTMLQEGSCICTAASDSYCTDSPFPSLTTSFRLESLLKLHGSLIILVILIHWVPLIFLLLDYFVCILSFFVFIQCFFPPPLTSLSSPSHLECPSSMSQFITSLFHSLPPSSNKVPIKLTLPLLHLTVANKTELGLQGSVMHEKWWKREEEGKYVPHFQCACGTLQFVGQA